MQRLILLLWLASPAIGAASDYDIIAYHDVRDSVFDNYDPDQYAISTSNLLAHFRWLRESGFTPVSASQILEVEAGRGTLPPNSVLLTFDDGFQSFYTRVYPLLQLFDYPAVVSVVSSWIGSDDAIDYDGVMSDSSNFLTWEQIREMQDSGLVEVASHTHNLHRGIPANPQGSELPAAAARVYDGTSYEDEESYRQRVTEDLTQSMTTIAEQTGHPVRIITWPFGAFTEIAADVAYEAGMKLSLTLEPDDSEYRGLHHRGRLLVFGNPALADLSAELLLPGRTEILRVAQVDLDYVYDEDSAQQETNIGQLLDRIKALNISHVYLQAFADPDGDGAADALYFPNRHLPVRADLFSRVAWALKTRSDVRVYAWMPMLSFTGGPFREDMRVVKAGSDSTSNGARLSPFHPEAVELIGEIYDDLATYSRFDGLLFHDDGTLNELEDFNESAMSEYRKHLGSAFSPEQLISDPALQYRFAQLKTQSLIDLTNSLSDRVRHHLPALRTARNIFASALLDENSATYLAQEYDAFIDAYDHVALLAMPGLEGRTDSDHFFKELATAVGQHESGFEKTVFELQTVDWFAAERIDGSEIRRTMRRLQSLGVRHLGYYPDDFIGGHPGIEDLRMGMSLAEEFGLNR
jgi:biofilm PGA synthesis lipoprotein PgaB